MKNAQRLKAKEHLFTYETSKIPRPTEVCVAGNWDDWKEPVKMKFDEATKKWTHRPKLKPGVYHYKFVVDNEWLLNSNEEVEIDINGNENHIVMIE